VTSVVQGYNGTILCYGQTGAGKTFTMSGSSTEYKYRGMVPRAVAQVYHEIADRFD
jgi:kinesin family protein 6/9